MFPAAKCSSSLKVFMLSTQVEEKEQLRDTGTHKFPAKFVSKQTELNEV